VFQNLVHSKATGVENRTTRSWPWPATRGQGHINEVKATAFCVKSRAFKAKAKKLALSQGLTCLIISRYLYFVCAVCTIYISLVTNVMMMMMMMMMIVIVDKKQLLGCTRNNSLTIVDLPSGNVKASLRQVYFSVVMDIEFPLPLRWLATTEVTPPPRWLPRWWCSTAFLMVLLGTVP